MEDYETDDLLGDLDFSRQRSFSWSHPQRAAVIGKWVEEYERGLVREQSDESIFDDRKVPVETAQQQQSQSMIQNGTGKKRRKSYTEIIATAILSSAEKRLTLAEIYDWMASNVDEYKNQRYVPSSSSWKNAVRHNLSVQSCFKRVKRHGVEKPSWWTVDMRQAAKRRLLIQPIIPQQKNGNGQQHEVEQLRMPRKRSPPLESVSEEETSGFMKGIDWCLNGLLESDGTEHAYSMNGDVNGGRGQVEFTLDGQINQNLIQKQIITNSGVNQQQQQPMEMSADQLTQAWINRFKVPGSNVIITKDGSGLQTLRVQTVHGVEQNVRFMGPLRVNVVLRCDKSTQTDDLLSIDSTKIDVEGEKLQSQVEVVNSGFSFEPLSFSRACSIDDHTIINLGPESIFDVSKIMHGDVKMPTSTMNILSPSVFDEEGLMTCWNAVNFNTDDMLNFPNA